MVELAVLPSAVVELVLVELEGGDRWVPGTVAQVAPEMRQFARFVERGHRVAALDDITETMVRAFVDAPSSTSVVPSAPVRYHRRNAIRLLFRVARRLDAASGDPSIDVHLPPWEQRPFRPLDTEEVELCRSISLGDPLQRQSIAWALAEATARNGELVQVRRSDVDLDARTVQLAGTGQVDRRTGLLTEWGVRQLHRELKSQPTDPATLLLATRPIGPRGRIREHRVRDVLNRAGLRRADGVSPTSVPGWVGRKVFDETGRLELVAKRCGCRSLDSAAHLIGWDWRIAG